MTMTTLEDMPNFTVSAGRVQINEAASQLVAEHDRLTRQRGELTAAFVGAFMALLLQEHPWLKAADITAWASDEYNDQGGTFRCISVSVSNSSAAAGAQLPDSVSEDGEFISDAADDLVRDAVEDCASDFYAAFADDDEYAEVRVRLSRAAVEHLLTAEPIDGRAVFAALFPAYASSSDASALVSTASVA